MATPVRMKRAIAVNHRSRFRGFKKDQIPLGFTFIINCVLVIPPSSIGIVKSTYSDLLAVIVMSPTATS